MSGLAEVIQFGVNVLNTVLGASPSSPTGTILAQTGDVIKGSNDANKSEWWQHVGFASRPSNPDAGKQACQALSFRGPDIDRIFATRDIRTNGIYGNLEPGESCLFGAGADGKAQGRMLVKGDGSVTMLTTDDNTAAGDAVFFRIHPTKGLMFVSPFGTFTFNQAGWFVTHQSGLGIQAGGAGLPGPASMLGSYFSVISAIQQLQGGLVVVGAGPTMPALWCTDVQAALPTGIIGTAPGVPLGIFGSAGVRVAGVPA